MSEFIKTQCEVCGHEFRKKCEKVCLWESEAPSFYDMFECDGYVGDGVYVEDIFPDYDEDEAEEFYGSDGKLLPQYGCGKCPSCKNRFWFEKVDK